MQSADLRFLHYPAAKYQLPGHASTGPAETESGSGASRSPLHKQSAAPPAACPRKGLVALVWSTVTR